MCWALQGLSPVWPGEDQDRCLPGLEGNSQGGGVAARPAASFSPEMPLPHASGPRRRSLGLRAVCRRSCSWPGLRAPTSSAAEGKGEEKWPGAAAAPAPPKGRTPRRSCREPVTRHALLGDKAPSSRDAGDQGPAGAGRAGNSSAPPAGLPAPGLCLPRETMFSFLFRDSFLELTPSWVCYFYPP